MEQSLFAVVTSFSSEEAATQVLQWYGPAAICLDLVLKPELPWQPVGTSFRSECEVSETATQVAE